MFHDGLSRENVFKSTVCAGKVYISVSSACEDSQVASIVVHASVHQKSELITNTRTNGVYVASGLRYWFSQWFGSRGQV